MGDDHDIGATSLTARGAVCVLEAAFGSWPLAIGQRRSPQGEGIAGIARHRNLIPPQKAKTGLFGDPGDRA